MLYLEVGCSCTDPLRNLRKSGICAFLALIVSIFTLIRFRWISSRSTSFLQLFWLSFRWETFFFISASIARRFTTTLRSFSFRVFFQRLSRFEWVPFARSSLVITGPHKRMALLSITRTTFITRRNACLVFKNWRGFYILIKLYSNFYNSECNCWF